MKKLDYKDLITSEEKAFEIISSREIWEVIEDSRYNPILVALRKGPMSVKELENQYNSIVVKRIEEMPLDAKEKKEFRKKAERKGKTLYKYLDILQKHGLVIPVGKRVKMGQTASETLFGRTAKVFFRSDKQLTKLKENELKKSIPVIAKIISMEKNAKEISENCLAKFIEKCFLLLHHERKRVLNKYSEEITNAASDASYEDLNLVIYAIEIYNYITHSNELNDLLDDCMKK